MFKYRSKYGNKKCACDGFKFDSLKEMRRYKELKLLQRGKIIDGLELQPRFLLEEKFEHEGKTIRKIEYIADFMYRDHEQGGVVVEDVKGHLTEVYKLKKKLFLKKYGEKYIFREIY